MLHPIRFAPLALTGAVMVLAFPASETANAACTPAAVAGAVATCFGATVNQADGAPGTSTGVNGYGAPAAINVNVSVLSSASVTGDNHGITGPHLMVINTGAVTGTGGSGVHSATDVRVLNSGTITAAGNGVDGNTGVIVTNTGTIAAGGTAVVSNFGAVTLRNDGTVGGSVFAVNAATDATVINTGAVTGGIAAGAALIVANSGSIVSNNTAVRAGTGGIVVNSGTITGGVNGVATGGSAVVVNSGTITGTTGDGIATGGNAAIANSGTIQGHAGIIINGAGAIITSGAILGATGGTAIRFNANGTPASDTLTVLPGARFSGVIDFGGGTDTLNLPPGSWTLDIVNFNVVTSTVDSGGNPVVVTPTQVVTAEVSGFGAMGRTLMDLTGWIGSVLPAAPVIAPETDGLSAFAAIETAAPSVNDAFASAATLGYQPIKAPRSGGATYADGSSVWFKGFGGRRDQPGGDRMIGSTSTGYGGAIGYQRSVTPDLSLGAFAGASTTRTRFDVHADGSDTDAAFAGVYGRLLRGASFLDLSLIGGRLDTTATRNSQGGLGPTTATASYTGWFINPALALGHRFAIGSGFTLTPAVRVRYVGAQFDGFTESGPSATLTVGGRTLQAVEERAELTLARVDRLGGHRLTSRIGGGVLGQQHSGTTVNVSLLGRDFVVTSSGQKNITGYFGTAGLDWQVGHATLFAAFEATATNDKARTYVGTGGIRVVW